MNNENIKNGKIENEKEGQLKRHRRSKKEIEGRIYICKCNKSYLSQPALNNHIKTKHPELNDNKEQRGRGRPRKIQKNFDFEIEKYNDFFLNDYKKKNENEIFNLNNIINQVFDSIFVSYGDKCFSHPKNFSENFILNSLLNNVIIDKKKNEKNVDEEFYEYLFCFKDKCNSNYYSLMIKLILLFKEFLNFKNSKINESNNDNNKLEYSSYNNGEKIPNLCNEFYTCFLDENNFFGIDEKDKIEIIEIIQHFCFWLYKEEYTKSKLSLAS